VPLAAEEVGTRSMLFLSNEGWMRWGEFAGLIAAVNTDRRFRNYISTLLSVAKISTPVRVPGSSFRQRIHSRTTAPTAWPAALRSVVFSPCRAGGKAGNYQLMSASSG
jgi:hypothetical protein